MKGKQIPPEFKAIISDSAIGDKVLQRILKKTKASVKKGKGYFAAFTDAAMDVGRKENLKKKPDPAVVALGVEAGLSRGKFSKALSLSKGSKDIRVLGLRAVGFFGSMDTAGIRSVLKSMEAQITDESPPADQIRLSTVRVLLAAAERDTSVIMAVMQFDNLLESHPEQVEEPLIETMFTLYVISSLLREVGQSTRARRIIDTLEDMAQKRKNRLFLALVEQEKGNICNFQGEYNQAESHYLRVKEISEELDFNLGLGMALNNLGSLMLNSLQLEQAFEYFKQSYKTMDTPTLKRWPLTSMGEIATLLGKYDEAEKYLKEGLKLEEKTERRIAEIRAWYAILLARTGRFDEAQTYLEELRQVVETSEKPYEKGTYLYARGIFEANQGDFEGSVEALNEALRIAKENSAFDMLARSKFELSRTFMHAYLVSRDPELLGQAAYHLDDLIQIAKEQELQALYAEALILRSDLRGYAGRIMEAKGDLERAASIAEFINDPRLQKDVETRLQTITATESIDVKLDEEKLSKTMDRVSSFKPAGTLKTVPLPDLHALIALNRNSGIPEYVHYFNEELGMDSSLISGFISAIAAFSDEFMADSGLLRSINHEGFTVMMEHTAARIVTLIASKETFDIRYLLHDFAERFEEKYPPEKGYDGTEVSQYSDAHKLVEEVFSIKIKTDS